MAAGEGRISPEQFRQRWRQQRRDEVKEAAPPQGLCLLRVGYPEPIFQGVRGTIANRGIG